MAKKKKSSVVVRQPAMDKTVSPVGVTVDPRIESMTLSDCLAIKHKKNPKEHDIAKLIESFERFGFVAYPTIDEATHVMVAGHGRCEALDQMYKSGAEPPAGVSVVNDDWMVPVVRGVSFASETERDAYLVADNQHVMVGGWNFDVLAEVMNSFRTVGFNGLGFEPVELDSMLKQYTDTASELAPDGGWDPEDNENVSRAGLVTEHVQFAVPLTREQSAKVHEAIKLAKGLTETKVNADALEAICNYYLEQHKE